MLALGSQQGTGDRVSDTLSLAAAVSNPLDPASAEGILRAIPETGVHRPVCLREQKPEMGMPLTGDGERFGLVTQCYP
jgi:hypothetical protein